MSDIRKISIEDVFNTPRFSKLFIVGTPIKYVVDFIKNNTNYEYFIFNDSLYRIMPDWNWVICNDVEVVS